MGKTRKDWQYGDQPPRDYRELANQLKEISQPKKKSSEFMERFNKLEELVKEKK